MPHILGRVKLGPERGPMKTFLTFLMALFLAKNLQAQECKVTGISDSPQKLRCSFSSNIDLLLTCGGEGLYHIKWSSPTEDTHETTIRQTYHMEVEEGPTPMVFKGNDLTLTIEESRRASFKAELEKEGKIFKGRCI